MSERCCGRRQKGGAYIESTLVEGGAPLEHFLVDPPQAVSHLHLPARGVTLFERDGVTHILDLVGEGSYPNTADMIEEIRALGMSRRIPQGIDWARLTPESRYYLAHNRARILNPQDLPRYSCPKLRRRTGVLTEVHDWPLPVCLGAVYHDLQGGEPCLSMRPAVAWVERTLPCGHTYRGSPAGGHALVETAIFARLPITRVAIVAGDNHEGALARARQSQLPVEVVDE